MTRPPDSAALAKLSRRLFGEKRFIAVAAAIDDGPPQFNQTQIADALGVSSSSIQGPLQSLVDTGFVTRLPAQPSERTRWLIRNPSALWTLIRELASRADLSAGTDPEPEQGNEPAPRLF